MERKNQDKLKNCGNNFCCLGEQKEQNKCVSFSFEIGMPDVNLTSLQR